MQGHLTAMPPAPPASCKRPVGKPPIPPAPFSPLPPSPPAISFTMPPTMFATFAATSPCTTSGIPSPSSSLRHDWQGPCSWHHMVSRRISSPSKKIQPSHYCHFAPCLPLGPCSDPTAAPCLCGRSLKPFSSMPRAPSLQTRGHSECHIYIASRRSNTP